MSKTESVLSPPDLFGAMLFASAAAIQRQVAEGMLAAFDLMADAIDGTVQANARLMAEIGDAETPLAMAAAGVAWLQSGLRTGMGWLRAVATRAASGAPAPRTPVAAMRPPPAQDKRVPVLPPAAMAPKPPAGKLRRAAPVVDKLPRRPARSAAK